MMVLEGVAFVGALVAGIAPQAGPDRAPSAAAPLVEIGASATDPNDQLFGVGPVLRTGEGGFLVVETRAGRIRVYDGEGGFVRDLGGQGDGPGEFREILDAALLGDTLAVLDRDGSITRLSLDGTVIGTARFDPTGLTDERFNPVPFGILPDGRLLVRASERVFGRADGEYVQRVGWLALDRRGQADTLGFPPSHAVRSDNGLPRPFRPWIDADFAAAGGALWVSVPSAGRLWRPSDGVEIRPAGASAAPTAADLDRFRERYLGRARSANDRRVIAEWVDEAPVAERLPPFRRFTVDRLGRVWLERWPASEGMTVWDVYNRDGAPVGQVSVVDELRLEAAGPEWILGVSTDALGVERVRLYAVEGVERAHFSQYRAWTDRHYIRSTVPWYVASVRHSASLSCGFRSPSEHRNASDGCSAGFRPAVLRDRDRDAMR